ncbi:MAG: hypothetical protein J3K34DRAFT_458868 [Monoraphidium minutum]|nr:MAG: hypothetical protein J3K34DRAFT_458868 [Monoraphidium minutum]
MPWGEAGRTRSGAGRARASGAPPAPRPHRAPPLLPPLPLPLLLLLLLAVAGAQAAKKGAPVARDDFFFYNEITGAVQWEDPGDVAFEDDAGLRFWLAGGGDKLSEDPAKMKYSWVEFWSEDLQRPYFHNQETLESTWERPVDLAWRRLRAPAKS